MDSPVKLHTHGRHVCGKNAKVDGDHFKFVGVGSSVGVVKILEPVSPMLNYFEIQIVDKGRDTALGLGLGEYRYPLDRMPGWNSNAIGYHADDGRLFHQNGYGKAFGPLCTTGDRMGCGVDFDTDMGINCVNVFFTKNGKQIGSSTKMKRPLHGLYPLVGLHSQGEKVEYLGHSRMLPESITVPMETNKSPSMHWLRSNAVRYLEDGLTLEYFGDGLSNQDVGIAQAMEPLTLTNHYFELKILDSGRDGWIAIGIGKSTYPLNRHPGWNAGSVGYHADNGHLYKGKGQGDMFGPPCGVGDIMGCGIRFPKGYCRQEEGVEYFEATDVFCALEEDNDYDEYYDKDDYEDDEFMMRSQLQQRVDHRLAGKKNVVSSSDSMNCTVYFSKNGDIVGETVCMLPPGGFYPLVAMMSVGEKIRVDLDPLSG